MILQCILDKLIIKFKDHHLKAMNLMNAFQFLSLYSFRRTSTKDSSWFLGNTQSYFTPIKSNFTPVTPYFASITPDSTPVTPDFAPNNT